MDTFQHGYFDEDNSRYRRQNTPVEMCQFTRIPMIRFKCVVYVADFFSVYGSDGETGVSQHHWSPCNPPNKINIPPAPTENRSTSLRQYGVEGYIEG